MRISFQVSNNHFSALCRKRNPIATQAQHEAGVAVFPVVMPPLPVTRMYGHRFVSLSLKLPSMPFRCNFCITEISATVP